MTEQKKQKAVPAFSLGIESVEERPGVFVVRVFREPTKREVARLPFSADFLAAMVNVGMGRLAEIQQAQAEKESVADVAKLVDAEGNKLL